MSNLLKMFFLTIVISVSCMAQDQPANQEKGDIVGDTKQDLYIITGVGLGGAILGLSTLSFVESPEDHYKNIIVGASLGIIGGVIVVATLQADRTGSYIDPEYVSFFDVKSKPHFDTLERTRWHKEQVSQNSVLNPNQIFATSYSF